MSHFSETVTYEHTSFEVDERMMQGHTLANCYDEKSLPSGLIGPKIINEESMHMV
jgi:hypothetical protein